MRAILVNPYDETITEVDLSSDYRDIYKFLTEPGKHTVDCFCTVRVNENSVMYLDDNGCLDAGYKVFGASFYPSQMLSGRGLICGVNDEGETVPCTLELETVKACITWTELKTTGRFTPSREENLGGIVHIDMGRPLFEG